LEGKIAEGGFEFGSSLPFFFHRPEGLSRVLYEPSVPKGRFGAPGTPGFGDIRHITFISCPTPLCLMRK